MRLKESGFDLIIIRPNSGADIYNLIDEAIVVSVNYGCDVHFKFNDKPYTISHEKLKQAVLT